MQRKEIHAFFKPLVVLFVFFIFCFISERQLDAEEAGAGYYELAVKKYLNNDLDGALFELDNYLNANPQDSKAVSLRSLIEDKKKNSSGHSKSDLSKTIVSAENTNKANEYFNYAFKKYLEGNFSDASVYLQKALELVPDFDKAKRFLKVIKKRQEGMLEDDSGFVKNLLQESEDKKVLSKVKAEEKVSVDFKNEDIGNVLRILSQLYNVNIVAAGNIDAKVTVSLMDVTLIEALDSILGAVGYSYVEEGDVIKVIDKNSYIVTRTFKLSNISLVNDQIGSESSTGGAEDLIKKLKDVLSKNGKLFYDKQQRTLMITDILERVDTISKLLSEIDVFGAQVLIEAKIVELSPSYNDYVGIDWSVLEGYAVTVESPTAAYSHSESRSSEPGVDWTDTAADDGDTYTHEKTLKQDVTYTLSKTLTSTLSAGNFKLVLSALKSKTDARVISSPNILTKGGQEAYITVSEQYPIPSYTYNDQTGSFEVSSFEYKDIGVILTVIPYPIEDGYVSLVVVPEISKKSGTTTFGGAGGAEIPIISTTKIKTQAFIKTGHTLAIGGLIKEEANNIEKKVPMLSSIPLIGNLFKYKGTSSEKKNLIIFITPTIITKNNMDVITAIQGKKLGSEYEIKLPEAKEEKIRPEWGKKYKRKLENSHK